MPKPNSALSSNKELAQAGPSPLLFVVYGKDGLEPPQIEEQPPNVVLRVTQETDNSTLFMTPTACHSGLWHWQ